MIIDYKETKATMVRVVELWSCRHENGGRGCG